jgi:hypothetical protein
VTEYCIVRENNKFHRPLLNPPAEISATRFADWLTHKSVR